MTTINPTAAATGDKHADGQGLYLHVKQAGKYWRMSYRFDSKQKLLALGVYPAVSLAKARQRRDKARELLADGIDPSTAKKEGRRADAMAAANTFELVRVSSCKPRLMRGQPAIRRSGCAGW